MVLVEKISKFKIQNSEFKNTPLERSETPLEGEARDSPRTK